MRYGGGLDDGFAYYQIHPHPHPHQNVSYFVGGVDDDSVLGESGHICGHGDDAEAPLRQLFLPI